MGSLVLAFPMINHLRKNYPNLELSFLVFEISAKADQNIDFLLGCREFSKPMPLSRIISNTITSKIITILKTKTINDSQCGYRRYKINMIKNLTFLENGYLFESEILLNCINKNMNIHNINIQVIYDGSPSHINKLSDSIGFIRLITRYIFA